MQFVVLRHLFGGGFPPLARPWKFPLSGLFPEIPPPPFPRGSHLHRRRTIALCHRSPRVRLDPRPLEHWNYSQTICAIRRCVFPDLTRYLRVCRPLGLLHPAALPTEQEWQHAEQWESARWEKLAVPRRSTHSQIQSGLPPLDNFPQGARETGISPLRQSRSPRLDSYPYSSAEPLHRESQRPLPIE